jgi:hypothetical protein
VTEGAPIEVLRGECLALLASPVPRETLDGRVGAPEIGNPAMAEAHHAVVALACASFPCLPFALGTVFADRATLDEWLAARATVLARALDDVRGCDEWIVALHEDAPHHAAWLRQHDADLRRMAAHAQATDEGAGGLLEMRLAAIGDAVRAARRAIMAARLAVLLDRHTKLPSPDGPYDGCWTALLPRVGGPVLSDVLADIAADTAGTGLSVSLSGPWPPYGFARRAAGDRRTGHGNPRRPR